VIFQQLHQQIVQGIQLAIYSDEAKRSNVLETYTFSINNDPVTSEANIAVEVVSAQSGSTNFNLVRDNLVAFAQMVQELCEARHTLPRTY